MTHSISPSEFLRDLYAAAVRAADPGPLVTRALARDPLPPGPVCLVGLGKAALAMTDAAVAVLAALGRAPASGIIVVPEAGPAPHPALTIVAGDHPVPGPRSFAAAAAVADTIAAMPADATVWVLLSGGTSSLAGAPAPGITAAELASQTRDLLASGGSIGDVNAARSQLLRWGAGRLAIALAPRPVHCLVLSDVIGNDLATIASGACEAPAQGRRLSHVRTTIVGDNMTALRGAEERSGGLGIPCEIADRPVLGAAAAAGVALATEALEVRGRRCVIHGGETTVALGDDPGRGGRSQELALAAARVMAGHTGITLLAAGTDGRDGPTDAAGAIVDGSTWEAVVRAGRDPARDLARHDSNAALDAAGALLRTGHTGTNVADIVLCYVPA